MYIYNYYVIKMFDHFKPQQYPTRTDFTKILIKLSSELDKRLVKI